MPQRRTASLFKTFKLVLHPAAHHGKLPPLPRACDCAHLDELRPMSDMIPGGDALDADKKNLLPRSRRASARNVEFRPIEVAVQDGNVNRALSMLKRKMAAEGIYKELRKRRFFEKPSEEKKRRSREAERRRKKATRIQREKV